MDWAALAILLLLWPLMVFTTKWVSLDFRFAAAVAALPLLLVETMRIMRFAGFLDELTFREWFDHDLGIIGYRTLYRMMYGIQFFFTRPTVVGVLCFYAMLGVSLYGQILMVGMMDGALDAMMLLMCVGAFILLIWPQIVRRERRSWPEI